MNVFISWSGDRSRAVGEALRVWLPRVIQSVKPWMSQEDISAGSRWLSEVSTSLDTSQVGILCVTPENQHNPWLLFEAGAISKSIDKSRVCPLLFDMTAGQLSGPLTQFQSHLLDKAGTGRILSALNSYLGDSKLSEPDLEQILEVWWPQLEKAVKEIQPINVAPTTRSTQDQLDELLSIGREQIRRENLRLEANSYRDQHMDTLMGHMSKSLGAAQKMQRMLEQLGHAVTNNNDDAMPRDLQMMFGAMVEPAIDVKSMKLVQDGLADMREFQKRNIDQIISSGTEGEEGKLPPIADPDPA